ncbi:MAG: hypothetical protein U0W40_13580 [Acidimicrobiia bacterium]
MTERSTKGIAPVASSHRRPRVRALSMVVASVAATVGMALTASFAPAGAAGGSAKSQLQTAVAAMQQVPGYTFTAAVGNGAGKVKITGEYQAPDRIHETVQIGTQAPSEVVMVGTDVYAKNAAGAWQKAQPTGTTTSDLRTTFAALQQASGVKQSGKVVTFTLAPKAAASLVGAQATGKVKGRAKIANGRITQLSYATKVNGQSVPVKITYTFPTPTPTVTAPA